LKDNILEKDCFRFVEKLLYNLNEMDRYIENTKNLISSIENNDSLALRAITYDNIKSSKTYKIQNAVKDEVIDRVKVIQDLQMQLYSDITLKKTLDRAINNLSAIKKEIIKSRYVKNMNWTEMALELFYDEKTLRKYKNQAVKSIAVEIFGSRVFREEEPTLFEMIDL
jgi:DNA-directed RNA polymerase specialized sigma subunit